MYDEVEVIGEGTLIQHGKHNDRIYLQKLDARDVDLVLDQLQQLAHSHKYGKIFCKVPKNIAPQFIARGYMLEAFIPNFFGNNEDVFFVSKFLNSDRLLGIEDAQLLHLSDLLSEPLRKKDVSEKIASSYDVRKLGKADAEQIAAIYREVFESYPFPIHDAEYIIKTMDENIQYYGAEKNGVLAALASSEVDVEDKYAEMTDFATHKSHHGNNLSSMLLKTMEGQMKEQGITTLFTIARLNSIAMNKTFLRHDYHYSGTLLKNTNIAGKIESMNVHYKHL